LGKGDKSAEKAGTILAIVEIAANTMQVTDFPGA
jgi:hypothetical protein